MEDFASIAPDYIRPSQFADMRRRSLDPIHRLLFAVLTQAVGEALSVKRSSGSRRAAVHEHTPTTIRFLARRASRRRENARDWIFDDCGDGPFSFLSICETLEIDSQKLRARVREGGGPVGEEARAAA